MRSIFISLVSSLSAVWLLTFTPLASASNVYAILMLAGLWWLLQTILNPILKILLLPFNIVSFGVIGSLVSFFLIWFIFWLVPGFKIHSFIFFGFSISGVLLLVIISFCLALLEKLIYQILDAVLP